MDIVCIKCGRLMKVHKNGVGATQLIDIGGAVYRSFYYDEWRCPECHFQVLAGHGNPIYDVEQMATMQDVIYW